MKAPGGLRRFAAAVGTGLAALTPIASSAPDEPLVVPDFALLDTRGELHRLSRQADHDLVVLLVQADGCETAARAAQALRRLREEAARAAGTGPTLAWYVLVPGPAAEPEPGAVEARFQSASWGSVGAQARATGLADFVVLRDSTSLVAESLGAERSGEVVVVDPRTRELVFRGPVGDAALSRVLAGGRAEPRMRPTEGPPLAYEARRRHRSRPISYANEIAPLLIRRCAGCHVEGGVAPWAMTDHRRIQGWSRMIEEVVRTRRMPPAQIDPALADRFRDVHRLTTEEEQRLVHWIEAGAKKDPDEADPLTELGPREREWTFGTPDLIVEFALQEIPAEGLVPYRRVLVELGNREDLWVRALEFRPGVPEALHHLIVYLGNERREWDTTHETRLLAGYSPGKGQGQLLPVGTGRLIEAGANLVGQFHYTTNGRAQTDRTQLALYLHERPPARRLVTFRAWNGRFQIPPGAGDHRVKAWTPPFEEPVRLHSFTPHMHMRGKRMRYFAWMPDSSRHLLFSLPEFDFNWQLKYMLKEPIELPAGARVFVDGSFDNSELNPANPDPTAEVTWGQESTDEMFIGYFNYTTSAAQNWSRAPEHPGELNFPGRLEVLRCVRDLILAALTFALGALLLRPFVPVAEGGRLGAKLEHFERHRDEYDAVFFGASRVFRGVDPLRIFEGLQGSGHELKAFNFGAAGAWAFEQDYVYHRVLELEPANLRYVFYGGRPVGAALHTVQGFDGDENLFSHRGVQWHTPRMTWKVLASISLMTRSPLEKAALAIDHLELLARNLSNLGAGRRFAQRWLESPAERALRTKIAEAIQRQFGYHGLEALNRRRHGVEMGLLREDPDAYHRATYRIPGENAAPTDTSAVNLAVYEEQIEAARQRGIELVYFTMPGYEGDPERLRLAELGLLPALLHFNDPDRFPELFRIDARYDRGHLNDAGVERFARRFVEEFSALEQKRQGESGARR